MPTEIDRKSKATVIPIIISDGSPEFAKRIRNAGGLELAELTAKRIQGQIVSEEDAELIINNPEMLANQSIFTRPCVFCLFFDEHAPLTQLRSKEYKIVNCHVASFPIYCYMHSVGENPFKIKIEENHGLNYGRPFQTLCLTDNWQNVLSDILIPLERMIEQSTNYIGNDLNKAQSNIFKKSGNLFRLPYLRIFREDYSISIFYAGLEYILMFLHAFALIQHSYLTRHTPKSSLPKKNSLYVPKERFTDGFLFQWLTHSLKEKNTNSAIYDLLKSSPPNEVISGMNQLFEDLDMDFSLRKKNNNWLGFLESCIVLRNSTKGHGVTYYIRPETIRLLTKSVIELTTMFSLLPISFYGHFDAKTTCLDTIYTYTFERIDFFTKEWMAEKDNQVFMSDGEHNFNLFPNFLYNPFYDFFLFSGTSPDGTVWYYKNYSSGIHLSMSNPYSMEPEK